jgi:hypothetical protein
VPNEKNDEPSARQSRLNSRRFSNCLFWLLLLGAACAVWAAPARYDGLIHGQAKSFRTRRDTSAMMLHQ